MADFDLIDKSEPINMSGRVGFVPMLFRVTPEDPTEEERLVYSIQKHRQQTDIAGNETWEDTGQALWVMGRPRQLAEGLEEVGQALRELDHPQAPEQMEAPSSTPESET
jgi:hypothetical protein